MKKVISLLLLLCLFCPLLLSCRNDEAKIYDYFNTVCTLRSYNGDSKADFEKNESQFVTLLEKYHKLFDIYFSYSGVNNIYTINENAGKEPVKVSRELIDFLIYSKEMYTLTGGKVNIAMGAVLKIWHDKRTEANSPGGKASLPKESELHSAGEHTDINKLIIDEVNFTVYLSDPEMSLDVGAIAKGYAAQKIAEYFIERGISGYVIDLGGNISAIGKKANGDGWVTGIKNPIPNSESAYAAKIKIEDTSCVTSGDYERYYTVSGKRYHHIIDPDTLFPAAYFSSVTIIAKDSALADTLSTALFCMNEVDGRALIGNLTGVEVMWIYSDGRISYTDGFTKMLANS